MTQSSIAEDVRWAEEKGRALSAQAALDYEVLSKPGLSSSFDPGRLRRAYHVAMDRSDLTTAQHILRELARYEVARRAAMGL